MSQPSKLGEDKPHPVTLFSPFAQLPRRALERVALRIYKTLQIVRIIRPCPLSCVRHRFFTNPDWSASNVNAYLLVTRHFFLTRTPPALR